MATIKKFTKVDPKARVNLTLPESTRLLVEEYILFYIETFKEEPEKSELVDQLLLAWFDQDRDFQKFRDGMSEATKQKARKALTVAATATPGSRQD